MTTSVFNYDQTNDTLYVAFAPGEKATGIELNDHILLRLNKAERRAVGLTFFEYSLLAQRTEVGPRSFPLTGLAQLSEELRELVLEILSRQPVNCHPFLVCLFSFVNGNNYDYLVAAVAGTCSVIGLLSQNEPHRPRSSRFTDLDESLRLVKLTREV